MFAATSNLGLFSDDGKELDSPLSCLRDSDVETCEDFRLAFVMDGEVDVDAIKSFVASFGTGLCFCIGSYL